MTRLFLSIVLLTASSWAFAQDTSAEARFGNLREAMTEAEFKAAGLDKLSAAELAALDAWLQRKVSTETAVAVEQVRERAREEGRKAVVDENRGFFHFGSTDPIESSIAGEFTGFGKGRQYTLENGQVWEQTDNAQLAGVRRSSPKVSIKPGIVGAWYLRIEGSNSTAKVQRIK
ncbi:hypothetical protein [Pseudoxanthomonas putridarboris]|uniref:Secreted protein n=1 Tax=Pseudoxanthomonas putridarboris TaxID=752605 RepID=A0ABU9J4N2_9GAMM